MTEIYNAFRMGIVLVFAALVVYLGAQIVPQIQTAATLPERINAENAQQKALADAAPQFAALQLVAEHQRIENERRQAEASANAQTITAQATADAARMDAATRQTAIYGIIAVLLFVACATFAAVLIRATMADRAHQAALLLAKQYGATLELPTGERIQFRESGQPGAPTLAAPATFETLERSQTDAARVSLS